MVPGVNVGQDSNSRVAKRDSADERGCIVFLFPVIARRWFFSPIFFFFFFSLFMIKIWCELYRRRAFCPKYTTMMKGQNRPKEIKGYDCFPIKILEPTPLPINRKAR